MQSPCLRPQRVPVFLLMDRWRVKQSYWQVQLEAKPLQTCYSESLEELLQYF